MYSLLDPRRPQKRSEFVFYNLVSRWSRSCTHDKSFKKILLYTLQILNAGAGLMACGLVKDLGEGVSLARDVQRSGKANTVLDDWIKLSQVRFTGLIQSFTA